MNKNFTPTRVPILLESMINTFNTLRTVSGNEAATPMHFNLYIGTMVCIYHVMYLSAEFHDF